MIPDEYEEDPQAPVTFAAGLGGDDLDSFGDGVVILSRAAEELLGPWWGVEDPCLFVLFEVTDGPDRVQIMSDEEVLEVDVRVTPEAARADPCGALASAFSRGLSVAAKRRGLGPPPVMPWARVEAATAISTRLRAAKGDTADAILAAVRGSWGFEVEVQDDDDYYYELIDVRNLAGFADGMFLRLIRVLADRGRLPHDLPEIGLYRAFTQIVPHQMAWTLTESPTRGLGDLPALEASPSPAKVADPGFEQPRPGRPDGRKAPNSGERTNPDVQAYLTDDDELAPFGSDEGADLLEEWADRAAELRTMSLADVLADSAFDGSIDSVLTWRPETQTPLPVDDATIVQGGTFLLLALCGHIDPQGHAAGLKALHLLLETYPDQPILEEQLHILETWPR